MAENSVEIKQIFWSNVDWHRNNKNITWFDLVGGNAASAKDRSRNITLEKVQSIAELLEIDDYAILFEEIEGTEPNE
ncbi:hypothetical protein A5881_002947 [Enterococcus termitis]|nr:hypothetical protein A5881_002398 [Enterococcus termitis]